MFHIVFHEPAIPSNSGNAIRLAAATGAELHLIEPLGFEVDDRRLRRAGLDYHELASMRVHAGFDEAMTALDPERVYAFTTRARRHYTEVEYRPGDVFVFGRETDDLPQRILDHPRVTDSLRVPMLPGRRSLNLANCASLVVYEAWRQNGFAGGV